MSDGNSAGLQCPAEIRPASIREVNVEAHNVGCSRCHMLQGIGDSAGFSNDAEVALADQYETHCATHQWMVIDEKDPDGSR